MLHPADFTRPNAGCSPKGEAARFVTILGPIMTAVQIAQYVLAAMALATLVASDVLSWGLSEVLVALLGAIVGLVVKRPSDMLAPKV